MDMARLQNLLIKFEGRIGPNTLMQGAITILALSFIIQLIAIVVPILGIIGWALLYFMFCIYAKRLHDGGKPAVWTIAVIGAYIVATVILAGIMMPFLMGDAVAAAMRGDTTYGMGMGFRIKTFLVTMVIQVVAHLGLAFIVNQLVKGDPAPNAYGEPPVDAASINPLS